MEEIITVNGQQYKIELTAPITQEQRNEIIIQLGGTPGCSTCGGNQVATLATGCPAAPIPVGTVKTFTCNATGIGPFIFTLTINGVVVHTSLAIASPYSIPNVVFNTVGTYPVVLTVKDSCTGSVLTATDTCPSVTVQARALESMTVGGCTTSIGTAAPGNTCTVSVTGVDQFGVAFTPTGVSYTSSTPTVATVNSTSGLVTGINAGTTTITATSGTIKETKIITVTCTVPTCNFTMV